MNRAERRRHDRAQRKQPVLMVGDGIIGASLGEHFEPRPSAKLPPKRAGEHRWIAIASYVMPTQATDLIGREDVLKILGPHQMLYLGVGCYDCEQPWSDEIGPCPAEGDDQP